MISFVTSQMVYLIRSWFCFSLILSNRDKISEHTLKCQFVLLCFCCSCVWSWLLLKPWLQQLYLISLRAVVASSVVTPQVEVSLRTMVTSLVGTSPMVTSLVGTSQVVTSPVVTSLVGTSQVVTSSVEVSTKSPNLFKILISAQCNQLDTSSGQFNENLGI